MHHIVWFDTSDSLPNFHNTIKYVWDRVAYDYTQGLGAWASYQIRKFTAFGCAGNAGDVSPPPRVSDPDMHHGTCHVTHVPWCMMGSLINGFLWGPWRGKRSRHSRRMRNTLFYVSGKRPKQTHCDLNKMVTILQTKSFSKECFE